MNNLLKTKEERIVYFGSDPLNTGCYYVNNQMEVYLYYNARFNNNTRELSIDISIHFGITE